MENTNESEVTITDERGQGLPEPPPPAEDEIDETEDAGEEEAGEEQTKPAAADNKPVVDTRVEDPYTIEGCTISFTISYLPEKDGSRKVAVSVRNGMDFPLIRSFSSEDLPMASLPPQLRSLLQELEGTLPARQEENTKNKKKPMIYGPDPTYKAGAKKPALPAPAQNKKLEIKPKPNKKTEKPVPAGPSIFDWLG